MSYFRLLTRLAAFAGVCLFTVGPAVAGDVEGSGVCVQCENEARAKNIRELNEAFSEVLKEFRADQATKKARAQESILKNRVEITRDKKLKIIEPAEKKSAITSAKDVDWSQYPEIAKYSSSSTVQKMIDYALSRVGRCQGHMGEVPAPCGKKYFGTTKPEGRSIGMCYKYVKLAMLKSGLISKRLQHIKVNDPKDNAIHQLADLGFKNLIDDPKYRDIVKNPANGPKGAIYIYKGGGSGGHIEIKTGSGINGGFASDFRAGKSVINNALGGVASRRYEVIGVMVRPGG